ncbi:hypothetical protein BC628DRAFT_1168274 [Trametes gibbosa]|nr:hypothetical protein BC628DRAFT_1168274 [Trametes gibbosa]
MPKEAKEPLFCCGAQHKSANYHKRTVHQKHTKIYFRGHPEAGFILRRNPVTSLFHCPKCDRSWAMATPVRMHIFSKCEGYAQYRTEASATSTEESVNDISMDVSSGSVVVATRTANDAREHAGDRRHDMTAQTNISALISRKPQLGTTLPPSPLLPDIMTSSDDTHEQIQSMPPILRPAVWSPVIGSHAVCQPPLTLSAASSTSLGPLPGLTRSASSCSSGSSGHTLAGDTLPVSRTVAVRFKSELDEGASDFLRRGITRSGAPLPSPPALQQLSERPTAIRTFLNNLRRPLGHAAPLFYQMGLVNEEDLTLICTMPMAWDEVGAVLQVGGLTIIEWLMVREAFKARARGLIE